jgi:ribonuclease P protein component
VDERLRTYERLTVAADFRRCYRLGAQLRTSFFTIYAYHREGTVVRFGLAVGKTVGPAVVRNRVKRRLREIFRRHKGLVPQGYDLFVRAVPASAAAPFAELLAAWKEAISRLRGLGVGDDADRKAP